MPSDQAASSEQDSSSSVNGAKASQAKASQAKAEKKETRGSSSTGANHRSASTRTDVKPTVGASLKKNLVGLDRWQPSYFSFLVKLKRGLAALVLLAIMALLSGLLAILVWFDIVNVASIEPLSEYLGFSFYLNPSHLLLATGLTFSLAVGVLCLKISVSFHEYRRVIHNFRQGHLGLAKVIESSPNWIVVQTDLDKDRTGRYPAIKVQTWQQMKLGWRTLRVGDYFGVVVDYTGCKNKECQHFHDFTAWPIEPLAENKAQLTQLLRLFSPNDFKRLDRMVEELPAKLRPTIYKQMEESDWSYDQLIQHP